MDQAGCHSIRRFLDTEKRKYGSLENQVTRKIMKYQRTISLEAIVRETDYSVWEEYYVLLEFDKYSDSPKYLSNIFWEISKFLLEFPEIDSSGIQEIECSENNYYILIYFIYERQEKQK